MTTTVPLPAATPQPEAPTTWPMQPAAPVAAPDDDVPVSRDITTRRVLVLLACSIGTVMLLGLGLRTLDLEGPPLPLNIGAKLLTATVALSVVDRLGWWRRVGFRAPPWRRLGLAWLPALYVAFAFLPGVPLSDAARTAGVLVLALAVGLDEEVWTRGLLLESLRHRGSTVAVLVSAGVFGLVHAVNALTGQPVSTTALQVGVATAFGLALGALRVRCHSIWPPILVHALWDFALIARTGEIGSAEAATTRQALFTLAVMAPLAIYGLVLARPSKVPGPDGRLPRAGGSASVDLHAAPDPVPAAPPVADALGRWPAAPPEVAALRRGW